MYDARGDAPSLRVERAAGFAAVLFLRAAVFRAAPIMATGEYSLRCVSLTASQLLAGVTRRKQPTQTNEQSIHVYSNETKNRYKTLKKRVSSCMPAMLALGCLSSSA